MRKKKMNHRIKLVSASLIILTHAACGGHNSPPTAAKGGPNSAGSPQSKQQTIQQKMSDAVLRLSEGTWQLTGFVCREQLTLPPENRVIQYQFSTPTQALVTQRVLDENFKEQSKVTHHVRTSCDSGSHITMTYEGTEETNRKIEELKAEIDRDPHQSAFLKAQLKALLTSLGSQSPPTFSGVPEIKSPTEIAIAGHPSDFLNFSDLNCDGGITELNLTSTDALAPSQHPIPQPHPDAKIPHPSTQDTIPSGTGPTGPSQPHSLPVTGLSAKQTPQKTRLELMSAYDVGTSLGLSPSNARTFAEQFAERSPQALENYKAAYHFSSTTFPGSISDDRKFAEQFAERDPQALENYKAAYHFSSTTFSGSISDHRKFAEQFAKKDRQALENYKVTHE
jgi:hypothetical protein